MSSSEVGKKLARKLRAECGQLSASQSVQGRTVSERSADDGQHVTGFGVIQERGALVAVLIVIEHLLGASRPAHVLGEEPFTRPENELGARHPASRRRGLAVLGGLLRLVLVVDRQIVDARARQRDDLFRNLRIHAIGARLGHLARILGRLRLEFAIRQKMQLRDGAIVVRAFDLHRERGKKGWWI